MMADTAVIPVVVAAAAAEEIEEEIEDEPEFTYERMGTNLSQVLGDDFITCTRVHSKFIAIGTRYGHIYIVDPFGNVVDGSKRYPVHSLPVNCVSLDANGEYFASCSDDGRVVLIGLYNSEQNEVVSVGRATRCVAVCPDYAKQGSNRRMVVGTCDELILLQRSLFRSFSQTKLHAERGGIRACSWFAGELVAFATDRGVHIYDLSTRTRIMFQERDQPRSGMQSQHFFSAPCRLVWTGPRTLLVAWANELKVLVVRDQVEAPAGSHAQARAKYVEFTNLYQLDYYICGVAPHSEAKNLVLLALEPPSGTSGSSFTKPHLFVIEMIDAVKFEILHDDILHLRDFEKLRCGDYQLEYLRDELGYYVISPRDVFSARKRTLDDRVRWFLTHDLYEEALSVAQKDVNARELKAFTVLQIAAKYVDYLLASRDYEKAARTCARVFVGAGTRSVEHWEDVAMRFANVQKLAVLAEFVPTEPRLNAAVYEMVLNELMHRHVTMFKEYIVKWPPELYSVTTMVNSVLSRLKVLKLDLENAASPPIGNASSNGLESYEVRIVLLECLALLYERDRKYGEAFRIYVRLRNPTLFDLVTKHGELVTELEIAESVSTMMRMNREVTLRILLDRLDNLNVQQVVTRLSGATDREFLFAYLDAVTQRDAALTREYHGRMVSLYAEYERPKLLHFLRTSQYVPLQEALAECRTREFRPETVFLLGRIGRPKEALNVLLHQFRETSSKSEAELIINEAIAFCREHKDRSELWDDLLAFAKDQPRFVIGLLRNESVIERGRAIRTVESIPSKLEVEGLKESVLTLLTNYKTAISVHQGCSSIMSADLVAMLSRFVGVRQRAISVHPEQTCPVCQNALLGGSSAASRHELVVFGCAHTFHKDCLLSHLSTMFAQLSSGKAKQNDISSACIICSNSGAMR